MDEKQFNNETDNTGTGTTENDLTAALSLIAEMKESLDAQTREIVELKKTNMKLALQATGPAPTTVEDAIFDAFIKK